MEIDVVYLKALILDCNDPIAVIQGAGLPGERDTEQRARNTLMRLFEQPRVYQRATHSAHLEAMRCLGVDVPEVDEVSVLAFKQINPPCTT